MASICPSCELPFRAGALVLVLDGKRAVRRRVCRGCAKSAVPVLFDPGPGRIKIKCENGCGRAATVCNRCVIDALDKTEKAATLTERVRRAERAVHGG